MENRKRLCFMLILLLLCGGWFYIFSPVRGMVDSGYITGSAEMEICNLEKETEENEEASTEEKEKLYAEIAMYHKVVYKGNLNYYFAIYNMDGKIVKDGISYKEEPVIDFVNETVLRIGFQEKEGSFQWAYYDILKDEFLEQYDEGENAEDEWLVYNSVSDFREEWDLPYADKDVFEMIWSAYENVDFSGEFQEGDRKMQDEYKGLFRKLLWNEEPFWDLHTGERFYLQEYNYFSGENFNPYEYKYYFFDGDGDGCPDLGVVNNGMKNIFKYDRQEKKFVLWLSGGAWYHWIGTGKILSNNLRGEYDFYTVDKNGILESSVSIFSNVWGEDRTFYAAMMPDYADVSKEMKVSDEMKRQGIFCRSNGQWYFRITREEYEKLAKLYLEASELVQEREKEVIYTYEELFGGQYGSKIL